MFSIISPDSAATSSFSVEEGDVVLVGTDGLFDNLSDDMILRHVRKIKVRPGWVDKYWGLSRELQFCLKIA